MPFPLLWLMHSIHHKSISCMLSFDMHVPVPVLHPAALLASSSSLSTMKVTGPSLTSDTSIIAPAISQQQTAYDDQSAMTWQSPRHAQGNEGNGHTITVPGLRSKQASLHTRCLTKNAILHLACMVFRQLQLKHLS